VVQEHQGSDCDKVGNTSECRRELRVYLGASGSASYKPGSADEKSGNADDMSVSPDEKPVSADNNPGRPWPRLRQAWEHLESLYSSPGKTPFLGTLLLSLVIIANTQHSTIFNTLVFSLDCYRCIYIAPHVRTVYLNWLLAVNERYSWCACK